MERGNGILMHISSLPSKWGIGTLGRAAYEFVDFLSKAGQKYWQVLPVSPTGYGDSPYQSYSTFAGNPYFIDLDMLTESGNLCPDDYKYIDWGWDTGYTDYEKIANNRINILKKAYYSDRESLREDIDEFRAKEAYWVENYAMFMALKERFGGLPYWEWDDDIKFRKSEAMTKAYCELGENIEFWIYVQFRFFEQWEKLKEYANDKGIKLIGDIPIYVAEDSADAWAHDEVLWLDEERRPVKVAGCPPDYFTPKGQLWGNPLYDWEYLKSTGYEWWILRIKAMFRICDIVRIDHFRAFSAYYSIPFGDEDATGGCWLDGPGGDFFDTLRNELGEDLPIIAEDLGLIDDGVRELLKYTEFPGMKVFQFAFDPSGQSDYLPHKYDKNCIAYIGTHDNDTLIGWYNSESEEVRRFMNEYLRIKDNLVWDAFAGLMASVADVTIVTMQDVLNLGQEARMNTPGRPCGNWQWRMRDNGVYNNGTAERLAKLTRLYGR
ncbi:MAG: 4-alpha-glucanotransferase [Clostridia bacterium]|nr:4-alpha-glucanotransferase [Clostridia bacterium]